MGNIKNKRTEAEPDDPTLNACRWWTILQTEMKLLETKIWNRDNLPMTVAEENELGEFVLLQYHKTAKILNIIRTPSRSHERSD